MKCPKCGYLGFENVELCRNCGYRFSLTATPPTPDLTLRTSRPDIAPLDDLSLIDNALEAADERDQREREAAPSVASVAGLKTPDPLPLFGGTRPEDDQVFVARASTPRPPLSVRRSTPEMARLKTEPRPSLLDLSISSFEAELTPARANEPAPMLARLPSPRAVAEIFAPRVLVPVGTRILEATLAQRYAASALDAAVILVTDLLILYCTMQLSGLALGDVALISGAPLAGFLIAQNVAYFIVFTAGGQTPGKMVLGIRVVDDAGERPPSLVHATVRTLAWIPLALPAGLGLLTVLLGEDARGLHDRVAGTRVVQVAA